MTKLFERDQTLREINSKKNIMECRNHRIEGKKYRNMEDTRRKVDDQINHELSSISRWLPLHRGSHFFNHFIGGIFRVKQIVSLGPWIFFTSYLASFAIVLSSDWCYLRQTCARTCPSKRSTRSNHYHKNSYTSFMTSKCIFLYMG